MVGARLGDACGDRSDAHFRHQFHRDAGRRVDVFQVVDELGQVLDRVDVMVRRRADQPHPGSRMAHPGDVGVDLVTGQLAALAGLGPLGHLDLDVVSVDQILRRHPEAT